MAAFGERVAALDGVRAVVEPQPLADGAAVVEVLPEGGGTDAAAARLVAGIHSLPAPFPVQVTGDAASLADYQATVADRRPLAAAVVVLATFVLLFLFTGSVVVPVKAIVMNVLSLGQLRGPGLGVPGRPPGLAAGGRGRRRHRPHRPGPHLRHHLRPVHGLRGVPAVADRGS